MGTVFQKVIENHMRVEKYPQRGVFLLALLAIGIVTSCIENPSTQTGGDIVVIGNGIEITWDRALVANTRRPDSALTISYLLADKGAVAVGDLVKSEPLATEEVSWVKSVGPESALVKLVETSESGTTLSGKCSLFQAHKSEVTCRTDFKISDRHEPSVMGDDDYVFLDAESTLRQGPLTAESVVMAQDIEDFFVRPLRAKTEPLSPHQADEINATGLVTKEIVFKTMAGDWFIEREGEVTRVSETKDAYVFPMPNAQLIKVEEDHEGPLAWTWSRFDFKSGRWAKVWTHYLPVVDSQSFMVKGDQLAVRSANGWYALREEGVFLLPLVETMNVAQVDGVLGRLLIRADYQEAGPDVGQLCQYVRSPTQEGYHCRTLKTRDGDRVTTSLLTQDFLVIALAGSPSDSSPLERQGLNRPVFDEVIALPSNSDDRQFAKIVKRWKVESVESIRFFSSDNVEGGV